MELIDNLEILKKDDYVAVFNSKANSRVGKVVYNTKEKLIIKIKYIWRKGEKSNVHKAWDIASVTIIKHPIKRKKKLRHKPKSKNDNFVIYKLNKTEKQRIINDELLDELELDN
jgi:hypothetical protein